MNKRKRICTGVILALILLASPGQMKALAEPVNEAADLFPSDIGKTWREANLEMPAIDEMAAEFTHTLEGDETAYAMPFPYKYEGISLQAGDVTVIGVWEETGLHQRTWYKIETDQGFLWFVPNYRYNTRIKQFSESLPKHEDVYEKHGVALMSAYFRDVFHVKVRLLNRHREQPSLEEIAALRSDFYEQAGGSFPLVIEYFVLGEQADLKGTITAVDKKQQRVLIIDHDDSSHKTPNANWVSFKGDATMFFKDGDETIGFDALHIGQYAEVWGGGATLLTYPGQTTGIEMAVQEPLSANDSAVAYTELVQDDLSAIDKIEIDYSFAEPLTLQDHDAIEEIVGKLKQIRLQQTDNSRPVANTYLYRMTLYSGDKKLSYSSALQWGDQKYAHTQATSELDYSVFLFYFGDRKKL
ncbi:hypothetical protein [Paenibacillus thalictri]|uniref:Uncharacterized protein n=1 Tax=Paenibacillus thalictri TaxID=2527873 RepID=A0A4Q9DZR2_9BACL|nr:hypothetical protein [Paenibacillus thalictri]TBL81640.1 hypothetical protein EYB31_01160 [Paenibacillus thalictri]